MATKTVQLLLIENVDNLGIVGDVVTVRVGYARNYLLPRGLCTEPNEEILRSLDQKREQAKKDMTRLRGEREGMVKKMEGLRLTLSRSCNDHGHLYGSVTQQDIAGALCEAGFAIRARDVRLPHTIKRLETYDVVIKLDADLETEIHLVVEADREMFDEERDEMEFDNEGNLIEKSDKPQKSAPKEPREAAPAE